LIAERVRIRLSQATPTWVTSTTIMQFRGELTDTAVLQNQLQSGHRISSATIYIENIWDWKVEKDKLFINLLDNPKVDVRNYLDNTSDTVLSNYFTENQFQ
jgi:hypothetical protein